MILIIISPIAVGYDSLIIFNNEAQQQRIPDTFFDPPWPMYCHDNKHTGRSSYSTSKNLGIIKWKFIHKGGIDSSPSINKDGTIYVGGNKYNGPFFAINSNGTEKWHFNTSDGWVSSSPAISEEGILYFGSWDHNLYAIFPNGTMKWKFHTPGTIKSSPTIATDGTIYFGILGPGTDIGRIFAINSNGTEKWHYDTEHYVFTSPAIGDDNTVYFTSNDNNLYAFNPNGTVNWKYKMGNRPGSPAISNDGVIYVGSWDGYLYAVNPNGTLRWKSAIGEGSARTPSIDDIGTIYIGDEKLYAINPDGTMKWTFNPGKDYYISSKSQAISADGSIYIGTSENTGYGGHLISVNSDGTERWRIWIHNEHVWSSPAIGTDGTVYLGSTSIEDGSPCGVLYAVGPLDPDAPEAPKIEGMAEGKVGMEYTYTFSASDPNNDDIYYYIEWGDGSVEEWIGSFESGEEVTFHHTWTKRGTYTIKARAKDTDNLWGDWATLEVKMPRNKPIMDLFETCFPEFFRLLKSI